MAAPKSNSLLLLFVVMFMVVVPTIRAHIAEYDDYWKAREKEAKTVAIDAFDPSPEDVNDDFNKNVEKSIFGKNGTRRNLKVNKGPCKATNPIDRCWRCRRNWAMDRRRLADCVLGFGRRTVGGKHGRLYIVTDPSDNDMLNPKPGTLRYAVIQPQPLWIVFGRSMIIKLKQELMVTSDKTIDGRGVNVHIAYGAGITIQFARNVIIHGLHIHDIVSRPGGLIRDSVHHFGLRTRSDGDGISIFGSSHVWIDHNSMSKCEDGLVDAIQGSTAITISNNHFTKHNETMLLGASDGYSGDIIMQVTVAFNHFGRGLIQRMPRCRWGFFHVVNNDYTHWNMYAVGGSAHPTIVSQGNRYVAAPLMDPKHDAKEVTKRDHATKAEWSKWTWRSEGDLMVNGAFFVQSGVPFKKKPFSRYDMIKAKPGKFVPRLTRYSGALTCWRTSPC
ncbi:pectate lyase [Vitis vinifera]|uniref:Pectate lyase n=3 Tax=Vitis vinifera TaxID=29760 RepID=D7TNE1_VITVI|eukprot:XP_002270112.1 PREDICTED: pectate lyase [Vitis vinifera]